MSHQSSPMDSTIMNVVSSAEDKNVPTKMRHLRMSLHDVFQKIASTVSVEDIGEIFADVEEFPKKPVKCSRLQNTLVRGLLQNMIPDADERMDLDDFSNTFAQLELLENNRLSSESSKNGEFNQHNVEKALKTELAHSKLAFCDDLEKLTLEKEAIVSQLREEVQKGREKIRRINREIERISGELSNEVDVIAKNTNEAETFLLTKVVVN